MEETDSAGEGIKKEGRKRRHREEARIWRRVAEEMLAELVYCTCMQISLCLSVKVTDVQLFLLKRPKWIGVNTAENEP